MNGQSKRIISLFALVSAASLAWGAQAARPDFSGKWTLDKSASRSAQADDWVSAERDIEQSAERVSCRTTINMEQGAAIMSLAEPTDGTWRVNGQPVEVGPDGLPVQGNKSMAKVELVEGKLVVRYKSVQEEGMETWTLSPDGKTLTIEIVNRPAGKEEKKYTEVYRKL